MKNVIISIAAGLVLSGNALASEPMKLTDFSLDAVSAGARTNIGAVTIRQGGYSSGYAATFGVSEVSGQTGTRRSSASGSGIVVGGGIGHAEWGTVNTVSVRAFNNQRRGGWGGGKLSF